MHNRVLQLTEKNTAFSRKIPGLQIAWDSTSLGLLKTCPWMYYLSMIEGWESKRQAVPLSFGIWFHEAMETYHRLRAEDSSHDSAMVEAVKKLLLATGTRDENNQWHPWESDDNRRTRQTLIRAVVWYLEAHKDDPIKTLILANGKPAVELSFKIPTGVTSPSGEEYIIAGHIDRLGLFQERPYVTDYKTSGSTLSSYFFDKFSPSNQMSLYTFAGNVILSEPLAGCIIDGVQVAVGFNRFGRGFAPRTTRQIDEWFDDTLQWLKLAEYYASNLHWPMNDTACSMYGGCRFRDVCSKDPAVRDNFLNADFVRRVWNPLINRGE